MELDDVNIAETTAPPVSFKTIIQPHVNKCSGF